MEKPMTPQEFTEAMKYVLANSGDQEGSHYEADKLIIKLLRQMGYTEGADLFDEADKWYA